MEISLGSHTQRYLQQGFSSLTTTQFESRSLPDKFDVNSRILVNGRPMTCLQFACSVNNHVLVSLLLKAPGIFNSAFKQAVIEACANGNTECVRLLANTGRVDWNKKDEGGLTPLYWAIANSHSDIIRIIVNQPNVDFNVTDPDGSSLAHTAVEACDKKSLKILLAQENFFCWNSRNKAGLTPLEYSLMEKPAWMVQLLIKCKRLDLKRNHFLEELIT